MLMAANPVDFLAQLWMLALVESVFYPQGNSLELAA
jgi:hypothetical protein